MFLAPDFKIAESALREEVVRNYKAFMHATEEIRTMEADIQTLKDLLGSTAVTLQVHFALYCYCLPTAVFAATAATAANKPMQPLPLPAYSLCLLIIPGMCFEISIWLRPLLWIREKYRPLRTDQGW